MNIYEILAIIITCVIGFFILMSLIGDSSNSSHFESWRKNYHERKLLKERNEQELKKYHLDYEVRMQELANERMKIEINAEFKKVDDVKFNTNEKN